MSCIDERVDILRVLMRLMATDARTKSYFREVGGFVYVLSSLVTLAKSEDDHDTSHGRESCLQLIFRCCQVIHLTNSDNSRS